MLPFVIMLIVPIIMQHVRIAGITVQKKNQRALFFFFMVLVFVVMLRHETVGNDTGNYIRIFYRFAGLSWNALCKVDMEIGFGYYAKLISLFFKNAQFFLAATAMLFIMMIYPTYKRLCVDASLTIVLFCTMSTFVMMFSGIRQMLAIGIGFIAYDFTRNKKLVPFALTVLLAISFHTSAFMLAFMYPLYHARITKKWLFVVVPVLVVCFIFNRPIFAALTLILEQYTTYETEISSTGAYTMLILFGAFTVFSFIIPDETKIDKETIGLRNFLLLSFAIQMFAPLHTLAMRMNYYYIIFIPLLLPKIIEYRSRRWSQVAMAGRHVMVIFFLLYFFLNANSGGSLHVFPYHFFWENVG